MWSSWSIPSNSLSYFQLIATYMDFTDIIRDE